MIGIKGPCTPYALRREFLDSPSQYWSASSGAVYPLVIRLKKRGLIRVKGTTGDDREGSLYVLTAAGSRALGDWLARLDAPASIGVPPDPLRSRVAFFSLLAPETRQKFVDNAIRELTISIERVRAHTEREKARGKTFEALVSAGAQRMVESRLAWLTDVAHVLGEMDRGKK
jgi:DNA-binding PadR family transcriptional regulator